MKVQIPTQCPSCNSNLARVNDQLFCNNEECEAANNKKILGFVRSMGIKGLGEKTIDKLNIQSIADIYSLDFRTVEKSIGSKLNEKLKAEIDKSSNIDVATFLSSFSIPLIGKTTARKVLDTNIAGLTYATLKEYGIGDKAATNLYTWIQDEYMPKYSKLPIKLVIPEDSSTTNHSIYTVCITGRVSGYTKAKLTEMFSMLGVKVSSSVTRETTHLICEKKNASAKEQKAEQLNIPIVTLNEFKEIIENVKNTTS